MKIKTQTKLMQLRSILNTVSDVSYAFNKLNKQYPLDSLGEGTAQEVMSAYGALLDDVTEVIKNYERKKTP